MKVSPPPSDKEPSYPTVAQAAGIIAAGLLATLPACTSEQTAPVEAAFPTGGVIPYEQSK